MQCDNFRTYAATVFKYSQTDQKQKPVEEYGHLPDLALDQFTDKAGLLLWSKEPASDLERLTGIRRNLSAAAYLDVNMV